MPVPGVHLTRFWSGMCHRGFKNIPVPYTNFSKKYIRPKVSHPVRGCRYHKSWAGMCEGVNKILPQNWMGHNKNGPKIGYNIELVQPKREREASAFGTDADAELHCFVNVSLP